MAQKQVYPGENNKNGPNRDKTDENHNPINEKDYKNKKVEKKEEIQTENREHVKTEKNAFSEQMMKEFVFKVDGLLRRSRDFAGLKVSENEDVLCEEPEKIIGEKEFREVEGVIKEFF